MPTEMPSRDVGHESSKLPLKPVLWCLAGFVAAALVIHLFLIGYGVILGSSYRDFGRVYQIQSSQVPRYPEPALQPDPKVDLQTYKSQAEHDLGSYGWVDRSQGVAKIPIERAMALLAARGVPVRPPVQDGPSELEFQRQKAAAAGTTSPQQTPKQRSP